MAASARPSTFKPDLVLLSATVGWALTFPIVKDSLAHASPSAFLTIRFALGTLVALPFALRARMDRVSLRCGTLLGLLCWAGYFLNTWGLRYTSSTRAGFVTSLSVVLVPVFAALFFRERAHRASWIGAGLAALGLFVMSAPTLLAGGSLLGDGLVVASALAYTFHILFTGRFAPKVAPATALFAQLAVVLVLSALALPFEETRLEPTPSLIATLLFTGICASALFIYAQLWAQARTSAVRAALIFTLEPLLAAVFSRFLLGDELSIETGQGGALIVLGILVAELWPRLEAKRSAPAVSQPQARGSVEGSSAEAQVLREVDR
jgi:drug/metabolite transporter (DMT)-like permease